MDLSYFENHNPKARIEIHLGSRCKSSSFPTLRITIQGRNFKSSHFWYIDISVDTLQWEDHKKKNYFCLFWDNLFVCCFLCFFKKVLYLWSDFFSKHYYLKLHPELYSEVCFRRAWGSRKEQLLQHQLFTSTSGYLHFKCSVYTVCYCKQQLCLYECRQSCSFQEMCQLVNKTKVSCPLLSLEE